MLIKKISVGEEVVIHGVPGDIGTRYYLHARNMADAILFVLRHLPPAMFPGASRPDRFNITGYDQVSNLQLAQAVAKLLGKPLRYRLVDFHSTRPGHDPHYGMDGEKIRAIGWKPPVSFTESLARTVHWSAQHPEWLLDDHAGAAV
jgi:dTDP-glucose 4,6-dehydratase